MNPAIRQIVGKTIASVVVSEENAGGPPTQLSLVFDDGTTYELYGDICATGRLDAGGEPAAIKYASKFEGQITRFGKDEAPASPLDRSDSQSSHGPKPLPPRSPSLHPPSGCSASTLSVLSKECLQEGNRIVERAYYVELVGSQFVVMCASPEALPTIVGGPFWTAIAAWKDPEHRAAESGAGSILFVTAPAYLTRDGSSVRSAWVVRQQVTLSQDTPSTDVVASASAVSALARVSIRFVLPTSVTGPNPRNLPG